MQAKVRLLDRVGFIPRKCFESRAEGNGFEIFTFLLLLLSYVVCRLLVINNAVFFLIAVYFDNEDTDNFSLMVRRGDIVGIVESDERPPDGYLKVSE